LNIFAPYGIVKDVAVKTPGYDEPVRQRSLRTHNLALVLRHVAASPAPISRAAVAAATGLTRATVSSIVEELLAGQLIVEVDPPPRAGAGRPGVGLALADHGPAGLGLEINVDYLAACVVDLTGRVRHRRIRRAQQRGRTPGDVLDDLIELAAATSADAVAGGHTIAGIGLAVPGLVADGVLRLAPNLDWHEVDIRDQLLTRAPRAGLAVDPATVTIDNEANLAALGELDADAGPDRRAASFLYVSGEIGVGAGIVVDGDLMRGRRGFAGEFGHVTIRPDGARCHCGARGCLEAYASQEAILRNAGVDPADPGGPVARVVALAQAGSTTALVALEEAGAAIGVAAATVVNLIDVDTIVLGGVYAPLAPWLTAPIGRELADRVLAARWAPVAVRPSVLGASATVIGAAGWAVRRVRETPSTWLAHASLTPA
jgi:predicted NBD/HSP70 family sugar kinase